MHVLSPDDIAKFLSTPFIQAFWPALVGLIFLFIAAAKGRRWLVLPILGVAGFYQAVHIGAL